MEAKTIYLEGASVPYAYSEENGVAIWRFDTSEEACPAPMISALIGLRLIDAPNKRLIMRNRLRPNGLLARVQNAYKITIEALADGTFEIVFDYAPNAESAELYENVTCPG
jgi:hypothetical protein